MDYAKYKRLRYGDYWNRHPYPMTASHAWAMIRGEQELADDVASEFDIEYDRWSDWHEDAAGNRYRVQMVPDYDYTSMAEESPWSADDDAANFAMHRAQGQSRSVALDLTREDKAWWQDAAEREREDGAYGLVVECVLPDGRRGQDSLWGLAGYDSPNQALFDNGLLDEALRYAKAKPLVTTWDSLVTL